MTIYSRVVLLFCGVSLPIGAANVSAASQEPTAVDVGRALFAASCAECHGATLAGGMGPSLTAAAFHDSWRGKPLRALYGRIISTMPLANPGSLSERQGTALTAFIAASNGVKFDAASVEAASDLGAITFIPSP